ncbi:MULTISPECIES: CRISPR system precrRNA processing endoribonuclease RAMP protein Cas6 [Mogibacterium]|uniref:CRISPR system precrRNA processing endoribonuclease RAMP protein Cas6 n=1 Tax=Mogibacterium timidum TaxID=35519 RepID=A0A7Y8VS10_9FIRM|nr:MULTISPECIES: CRISPR system precrRNA processing endoribonuclease RAMP protein Cas6 [Mogibacterium]NWO23576.1 CRISPR system precrRNA processing endoribonuclease RAMP protein Cas6 [Mogibacterium timidum]
MFYKLKIILDNSNKYDYKISSLLHGVLMQYISLEYADELHKNGLKPYTQHFEIEEENIIWTITTLTEEAKKNIIDKLVAANPDELYLEYKDDSLKVLKLELEKTEYSELLEKTYFGNCARIVRITFKTPTAFKVSGNYQFYPTVEHIFGSLIRKHDQVSEGTKIFSEEIMDEINEHVSIAGYNLRSRMFHLEGIKIPSFVGNITLKINGTRQFVNLINMLCEFGVYSGVGIKTAIGMGSIGVSQKSGKE